MKFSIGNSISFDKACHATADDVLAILVRISEIWTKAVVGRTQAIPIEELVCLPEGRIFLVYRDRDAMFERQRFDGEPDPSSWIRLEWHADRLTFIVNAWTSPSGRVVRKILQIDR